jgi:hypothetical protein
MFANWSQDQMLSNSGDQKTVEPQSTMFIFMLDKTILVPTFLHNILNTLILDEHFKLNIAQDNWFRSKSK